MTGEAQAVDEVIGEVDRLIEPIVAIPFDVFDKKQQSAWEALMAQFRQRVDEIEQKTLHFIDVSFKKLRSAEGAFELLQNFRSIESRESINRQMMMKYSDILEQFRKEIDVVRELFLKNRDNPPCGKNVPPLAGKIQWARTLFFRVKKTMLKLQTAQDMMQQEQGKAITKLYVSVGEEMRDFERKVGWARAATGL